MRTTTITTRLERAGVLDRPAAWLRALAARAPDGTVRDALRGTPLGHPAHPILVQVPIGAWLSSAVLDCVPGTGRASAELIAVGLAAAVPAAAAGAVDLAAAERPAQRRVGVAHAACNWIGIACYCASLTARMRHRPLRGRLWALGGLTAVGAGGYLGGHLAYRLGVGVDVPGPSPDGQPTGDLFTRVDAR
ncbi:DUF2231 domain-containing protein [Yinghuangia seranimata]|uniref:DUF2231 domain-containing protein n=1 Tax=Yinghuangia seranimata TaxID=408067 RepID=UPI00248ABEB3|nr:DUF2231 domain-containing protein [Yinghuangia seranimata]MDI2125489.1 DUF2231 domain-containing protein [Yinghuangia seranimata]